jgi:hypothetical protein
MEGASEAFSSMRSGWYGKQCCGSGSGIRIFSTLDPGSGMEKKSGSRSRMNIPDYFSHSLKTVVSIKNIKNV